MAFVFIVIVLLLIVVVIGYMTIRSHLVGRFVHAGVDRKDRLISYVVENQDSQISQLLRGSCKVLARFIILFDFEFDWEVFVFTIVEVVRLITAHCANQCTSFAEKTNKSGSLCLEAYHSL